MSTLAPSISTALIAAAVISTCCAVTAANAAGASKSDVLGVTIGMDLQEAMNVLAMEGAPCEPDNDLSQLRCSFSRDTWVGLTSTTATSNKVAAIRFVSPSAGERNRFEAKLVSAYGLTKSPDSQAYKMPNGSTFAISDNEFTMSNDAAALNLMQSDADADVEPKL